jgi:hypothetical protein
MLMPKKADSTLYLHYWPHTGSLWALMTPQFKGLQDSRHVHGSGESYFTKAPCAQRLERLGRVPFPSHTISHLSYFFDLPKTRDIT